MKKLLLLCGLCLIPINAYAHHGGFGRGFVGGLVGGMVGYGLMGGYGYPGYGYPGYGYNNYYIVPPPPPSPPPPPPSTFITTCSYDIYGNQVCTRVARPYGYGYGYGY